MVQRAHTSGHICTTLLHNVLPLTCAHEALWNLPRTIVVQNCHHLLHSLASSTALWFSGFSFDSPVVYVNLNWAVRHLPLCVWQRKDVRWDSVRYPVMLYSCCMALNENYFVRSRRSMQQFVTMAVGHFICSIWCNFFVRSIYKYVVSCYECLLLSHIPVNVAFVVPLGFRKSAWDYSVFHFNFL